MCESLGSTAPPSVHAGVPGDDPRGQLQPTGEVQRVSTYLLFNDVGGLIVEDGPEAIGVSCSFGIQAEVQGHINGGEFIPEVFLILQSNKEKHKGFVRCSLYNKQANI